MLLVMVLLTSCFYNELPEGLAAPNVLESKITLDVETRSETYEGEQLDQEYFVTATDLENYVKFRREESKRPDLSVKEVVSYGFDNSQTLFYILNYDEGWEVIAADKRVQPTLAHGENGSFTMNTDNEPMKFWMNKLANGVLQQRQVVDSEMSTRAETTEEETSLLNEHVAFWDYISPSDASTRIIINIPIKEPHLPPSDSITIGIQKKYYLNHIQDSSIETDYYGPYIETSWGQEDPWRECCPEINKKKCVVGCTPVSCGQMLYFLVDKYNLNIVSYENVECTILTNGDYLFNKSNPSTSWWSQMAISQSDTSQHKTQYVSALLVHLGDLLGTTYGLQETGGSSTPREAEKTLVFDYYNFNCTYLNSYSSSIVKSQLKTSHMPVMVRGENSEGGHSWIIDGCAESRRIVKRYYIYSSLDLSAADLIGYTKDDADGYDTEIYSSLGTIHMNWGWNGSNNGWFTDVTSAPASDPYDEDIEIMYGFIPN